MKNRILVIMSVLLALTAPIHAMACEEGEQETILCYDSDPVEMEATEADDDSDFSMRDEDCSGYDEDSMLLATPASSIGITGPSLIAGGKSYKYKLETDPANSNVDVSWSITPADSGVKIVSMNKSSIKIKVEAGCAIESCTISAVSKTNESVSASVDVVINPGYIKKMDIFDEGKAVSSKTITILRVKDDNSANAIRTSVKPDVQLTSSSGAEFRYTPYKVTNSDETLVTIETGGIIKATGNRTGTARITYTALDGSLNSEQKTLTKYIDVRVVNPVTEVRVGLPDKRSKYVAKGKTVKLTADVIGAHGSPWTKKVEYTSSNPTVATVNKDGLVTIKADSYSPVTITAIAKDGSYISGSIELIACNTVKNISIGDFPYTKANTDKIQKVSLAEGKLVLPVIYNEPDGGNASEKYTCPDIEVTSSHPKYLEASYADGYITLNPLNVYNTKNIVVSVKIQDGSETVKKWNFRVTE